MHVRNFFCSPAEFFAEEIPSPPSPVSYPSKVAPLPEDKPKPEGGEEEKKEGDEQLQMEQRRLHNANRVQNYFRAQEEERIPYPTLFHLEKKLQKAAMDLNEAIRGVKANAKKKFLETVEAHVNLGVDPCRGDQGNNTICKCPYPFRSYRKQEG